MISPNHTNKLKLSRFPFQTLDPTNVEGLLGPQASWVLPQLTACLARIIVPQKDGDKFSFKATSEHLRTRAETLTFEDGVPLTTDHLRGMFLVVKHCPRGSSLGSMKQVSDGIRYAANVPLALAALKQYKSINYSEWDWTDPARKLFLDKDMMEMSNHFGNITPFSDQPILFDNNTLINYRDNSRLVKTGKTAGKIRPLNSTVTITKTGDDVFNNLSRFAKLSLCQTWIFQPALYHNLMINNLINLDSNMEPLVDSEVVITTKSKSLSAVVNNYYEENLF